jgi:hypothetical protein
VLRESRERNDHIMKLCPPIKHKVWKQKQRKFVNVAKSSTIKGNQNVILAALRLRLHILALYVGKALNQEIQGRIVIHVVVHGRHMALKLEAAECPIPNTGNNI